MKDDASTSPKGSGIWAISVGTALAVWLGGALFPALRLAENWVSDQLRLTLAPTPPLAANIALVTITEETLAKLPYRSPVNRHMLADAVDKIRQSGAKGLALDILFDQPTEPEADQRLYTSLRQAARGMKVVAAFAGPGDNLTPSQAEFLNLYTDGLELGLVNLLTDPDDGAVRWLLLGKETPGKGVLPGLAAALAGRSAEAGAWPLAYARSPSAIPSYPLHTLPLLPPSWLAGKFLLIGADLPHGDRHRTPASSLTDQPDGVMPGVAIHAHILNQLLSGTRLHEAPPWVLAPTGFILALLAAYIFGLNARLGRKAALGSCLVAGYAGLAALAALEGLLLPIVSPLLAALLASGIKGGLEWRLEQGQRLYIQEAFSRYLSPSVVKLLVQDPSRLKLGGELREITYVFTDIAGFTSISEKLPPAQMAEILNGYLDRMCQIALEHEATIDKIVGDAVVAFFNAPLDQTDHAERGVRLALAYDAFCEGFRDDWRQKGIELGVTRIGVNTGRATVGNFGGQRFFNYTGHGDSVNTAARLESVNKHLGTRICISGQTAGRCPAIRFRPVATLVLKGKTIGLDAFEPLTGQEPYAPLEAYLAAFQRMSEHDPAAKEAFLNLAERYPADPLPALHARRLEAGETGVKLILSEK
jgi:adenylate cyclase